jgi:predicted nucleotidyltransferase
MDKETVLEIIKDYLYALRQAGLQVSQAVLYGSWARNEARLESDIDLIVLAPEFDAGQDQDLIDQLWEITAAVPEAWCIEPIACGEQEWLTDDSRAIIEIARREGELIRLEPETA